MAKYLLSALLAFLVSISALAYGGRPHYVGPGVAGASLTHARKPVYQNRDTTANYVTIARSGGGQYNSNDVNTLYLGQAHRVWAKHNGNLTVGAVGYSGAYEHAYGFTPRKMPYYGGGILLSAEFVTRGPVIDWYYGPQLSFLYETGKLHDFLDSPGKFTDTAQYYSGIKVTHTHSGNFFPGFGLTTGFVIKPFRSLYFAPAIGLGHSGSRGCYYGYLSAGYGPIGLHFSFQNNSEIFKVAGKTLGLSVAIPNWPSKPPAPD